MQASARTSWRTPAAALAAMVMIGVSYLVSYEVRAPRLAQASLEEELFATLAARDSDNDGLRDWEEALYGTDPRNPDSRGLGMSDSAAVGKGLVVPLSPALVSTASTTVSRLDPALVVPAPGTITRSLAESFFTSYMEAIEQSSDGTLTPAQLRALSDAILGELGDALVPSAQYRTRETIRVAGSGEEALRVYAAEAETVFTSRTVTASKSDIAYLKALLEDTDPQAAEQLVSIAKTYEEIAAGLAVLTVPVEAATDHLALINAMARLGQIASDFTRAESDPFATVLALRQYPEAIKELGGAFIGIHKVYRAQSIVFTDGEAGAAFVNLIEEVAMRQKASAPVTP